MSENTNFINSINLNADTDFPYLVLDVTDDRSYPRNPGFRVMHWHEDLQFIFLLSGSIEVKTLDKTIVLQEGEAVFINKNIIHLVMPNGRCHYYSFIFPDYFLKFYFKSPAEILVDHITNNSHLSIYHFIPGTVWCDDVISALKKMITLEKNKTEFYVYEILVQLSTLWLDFQKNIFLPPKKPLDPVNIRMQAFLTYIETHYGNEISLDNLAKSGNVSKSECLRCFKTSMQTTPYKYIMEYRLSKAAALLKATDEPIGNIASDVGFRQISHFGKCFREKTGYSPREYRNIYMDKSSQH